MNWPKFTEQYKRPISKQIIHLASKNVFNSNRFRFIKDVNETVPSEERLNKLLEDSLLEKKTVMETKVSCYHRKTYISSVHCKRVNFTINRKS